MSKAYDRVDWGFLKKVMQRIGFAHQWIDWIMACVTTVKYMVKFNGGLLDSFSPSRGLLQGDPLSPFLFLFVADGLSALLHNEVQNNMITPKKICRNAPGISHLLFADDSLLFFKATPEEAGRVKQVIEEYASSMGQLINSAKCSIFFGDSCPNATREAVKEVLHVQHEAFDAKYLGLPTPHGRMNKEKFESLRSSLAKSLMEWGDNHLTQVAKEVFIKSIAQALPIYIMGVFKLPFGLCEELTRMIHNYWWGEENGKRKTHWMAWEYMMRNKDRGGIGFRDLRLFNQALLARQAWRLVQNPQSLCARVLKAKYFPNGSLLDTVFTGNASATWQALVHGLALLKKGIIWRVGNSANIRAWRDPWIPRTTTFTPLSQQGRCRLRWVSDFILADGTWNETLLRRWFLQMDVEAILQITPSRRNTDDFVAWQPDKRGVFSVSSAYKLALEEQMVAQGVGATSTRSAGERPIWRLIWQCPVPPKMRTHAWRVATNSLATQANMHRRGMQTLARCTICGGDDEDTFHVFITCPPARNFWSLMRTVWILPPEDCIIHTGREWLLNLLSKLSETQRAMTLMIIRRIWHIHNEITHDKPMPSMEGSKRFLMSYLDLLLVIKQAPTADPIKVKP
jgi:hypothetical protein